MHQSVPSSSVTDATCPLQCGRNRSSWRRANPDGAFRVPGRELLDGHLGDEPTLADDDDLIGSHRHLAHEVARDEDGTSFGCEPLQQAAHPTDAIGVEPVYWFIEQQHTGVTEQRLGDAKSLTHP